MKTGLVGYGSIGKRHVNNLLSLGFSDIILFREKGRSNEHNLTEIYDYETFSKMDLDFFIISNPSTFHFRSITPLIKENRNVLVEKPLVFTMQEYSELQKQLLHYRGKGMVAYNMRFHPCVKRIVSVLGEGLIGKPYSARLFVGQYLPDWRPGQDYSKGVSALKELGGGVVLELIHEIDMAIFLFGEPISEINSISGRFSDLKINTEDLSEILYKSAKNIVVSIHQDYLIRDYRRTIEVVGEKGTLLCDLKAASIKTVSENGKLELDESFRFERNDMYLEMIKYYSDCIRNNIMPEPGLAESLNSVHVALEVKNNDNL